MQSITFHEFYQFLLSEMRERFPDMEYRILAGGDYVQNVILEVSFSANKCTFCPYDLYQSAEQQNNYEDVVIQFLEECSPHLASLS